MPTGMNEEQALTQYVNRLILEKGDNALSLAQQGALRQALREILQMRMEQGVVEALPDAELERLAQTIDSGANDEQVAQIFQSAQVDYQQVAQAVLQQFRDDYLHQMNSLQVIADYEQANPKPTNTLHVEKMSEQEVAALKTAAQQAEAEANAKAEQLKAAEAAAATEQPVAEPASDASGAQPAQDVTAAMQAAQAAVAGAIQGMDTAAPTNEVTVPVNEAVAPVNGVTAPVNETISGVGNMTDNTNMVGEVK